MIENEGEERDGACPLCGSRPTKRRRTTAPADGYFGILEASSRAPSRPTTPPHDDLSDALANGYYERFFVEERLLGRGQRGAVYLCTHVLHRERLSTHAVKKVAVGSDSATLLATLKEVRQLSRLKHPTIISYQHSWVETTQLSQFAPRVPTLFVLLELANGGSLQQFVDNRLSARLEREDSSTTLSASEKLKRRRAATAGAAIHHLRVDEIASLFADIADGLAYLHANDVVHADLKSDNVLLRYEDSDSTTPRALLSDFGCSTSIASAQPHERTGATGTLDWLPPETLRFDACVDLGAR